MKDEDFSDLIRRELRLAGLFSERDPKPALYDLDSESELCSAVLCGHARTTDFKISASDFYSLFHKHLWVAIEAIVEAKLEITNASVLAALAEQQLVGSEIEGELEKLRGQPWVLIPKLHEQVEKIRELSKKRAIYESIVHGATAPQSSVSLVTIEHPPLNGKDSARVSEIRELDKSKQVAIETAKAEQNPFGWKSFEQVWVNSLPDERWICKELEIGPGRPCGLWGFGSSGKTMYAMVLCIAVASGMPAFDFFQVTHGTSCYVSHEMGSHACIERLRRLANGMLLEPSDLVNFKLSTYPEVMLNSPNAESIYCRSFEGVQFAVLDSLRAALPGVDENKSEMAQYMEILARVSEKVGTSFNMLHHTSKDDVKSTVEGVQRDKRLSGRGSSVIYDKSNSIWLLEGSGKKPRSLVQVRPHDDGDGISTQYVVELEYPDVTKPLFDSNRKPLRLKVSERTILNISAIDRIKAEIVALVTSTPAIETNSVTDRVKGKDSVKRTALRELEIEGKIVSRDGLKNSRIYYPPDFDEKA